jgi:nicotinamide riboside kinase
MFTVVVTGPESTGKSEICQFLAASYQTACIPEYAREYVSALNRPCTYQDVERIGRVQVEQLQRGREGNWPMLFLDTFLIITKVWFREVFGKVPDWIDRDLQAAGIDLFLLCYPDIAWEPDPLRENPEPWRSLLYEAYLSEIKQLGSPYEVVRGLGSDRLSQAENAVARHYNPLKDTP